MRTRVGVQALAAGAFCASDMGQPAGASEIAAMNVSSTFTDYMDLTRMFDPDVFRGLSTQDIVGALEATKILAVPGSEIGVGLPGLLALLIYAWVRLRRAYHRHVLAPEPVEDEWLIELPDRPDRALAARDLASFALVGTGLIITLAWTGFLVYLPGHLIGWW